MDATAQGSATVLGALGVGLPALLLHFGLVLGLLVIGIFVYMAVTPFHEPQLVRAGNTAAATVLGGALVALAIPLAALLATTGPLLDILVWGVVAVILQLVTNPVADREIFAKSIIVLNVPAKLILTVFHGRIADALRVLRWQSCFVRVEI